jgi:hypothetical protein
VDTLGLTDRFIAKLPRTYLLSEHPRPGHPDKRIPLWYLAQKEDLALIKGWQGALVRQDCAFGSATQRYKGSTDLYDPHTQLP